MARITRKCPLCPGMHVGDERHHFFECLAFDDICHGFQHLSYDSHGAMHLFMWHPHQKDGALCLLQLPDGIDEILTWTSHCILSALLAAWTKDW